MRLYLYTGTSSAELPEPAWGQLRVGGFAVCVC